MANNDRIFINPGGSDNERRLAAVESYAILDAIGWLELALKNGESIGTGLSPSMYEKVMKELATAFTASTARASYQQSVLTDETYDESMNAVKKVFSNLRENREKGLV